VRQLSNYAVLLVLAVTGLVHLIMFLTVGESAVFVARHAQIAPVAIARQIEILKSSNCRIRPIGVHDVINLFFSQGAVASDRSVAEWFVGIGRDDWRDNQSRTWRIQRVTTETGKPVVSLLHSVCANEYLTCRATTYCRGFSIIDPKNWYPHLFVGDYVGGMFIRSVIERPDVRSLVDLKLGSVINNALSRQSSLPIGDTSIDNDCKKSKPFEPNFMGFTSPIFLSFGIVCGCIFSALGIVSLFFIWGKTGEYSAAHVNIVLVFGLLLSAGFIWMGQWTFFSVFGLMP